MASKLMGDVFTAFSSNELRFFANFVVVDFAFGIAHRLKPTCTKYPFTIK